MRDIYQRADKVLVLDKSLQLVVASQSRSTLSGILELNLRIYLSNWMTRLWTLQEGFLPKTLLFVFADEVVEFFSLSKLKLPIAQGDIGAQCRNWVDIGPVHRAIKDSSTYADTIEFPLSLTLLSHSVAKRSTTVATDEPLCLATIAGVNLDKILEYIPEERMKGFWSLLGKYSRSLIFWQGPRLVDPGYRWAPASLVGDPSQTLKTDHLAMGTHEGLAAASLVTSLSGSGLHIRYPGVFLGIPKIAHIQPNFWVTSADDTKGYLVGLHGANGWHTKNMTVPEGLQDKPLTLIVNQILSPGEAFPQVSVTMVHVLRRDGDTIFVRRANSGWLFPPTFCGLWNKEQIEMNSMDEGRLREDSQGNIIKDGTYSIFRGDWSLDDVQWCVE